MVKEYIHPSFSRYTQYSGMERKAIVFSEEPVGELIGRYEDALSSAVRVANRAISNGDGGDLVFPPISSIAGTGVEVHLFPLNGVNIAVSSMRNDSEVPVYTEIHGGSGENTISYAQAVGDTVVQWNIFSFTLGQLFYVSVDYRVWEGVEGTDNKKWTGWKSRLVEIDKETYKALLRAADIGKVAADIFSRDESRLTGMITVRERIEWFFKEYDIHFQRYIVTFNNILRDLGLLDKNLSIVQLTSEREDNVSLLAGSVEGRRYVQCHSISNWPSIVEVDGKSVRKIWRGRGYVTTIISEVVYNGKQGLRWHQHREGYRPVTFIEIPNPEAQTMDVFVEYKGRDGGYKAPTITHTASVGLEFWPQSQLLDSDILFKMVQAICQNADRK